MSYGRTDAPILFVMLNAPSDGMLRWLWYTIQDIPNPIQRTDVRIVYILDEPPEGSHGRPTKEQIRANWGRFQDDMEASTPHVVVPFGGDALRLTTGVHVDINDARGYLIPPSLRGRVPTETWEKFAEYKTSNKVKGYTRGDPRYKWVKRDVDPLLPPDFMGWVIPSLGLDHLRMDGFASTAAFKSDMDRVARASTGRVQPIDDECGYVATLWAADDDYDGLFLAMDIETPIGSPVVERISLSDGERTFTLPWSEETRQWVSRQVRLVHQRGATLIFHNGAFDIPRLALAGCPIPEDISVFDTMLAGVVLQPDLPKGLGRMVPVYLDACPWKKDWEPWLGEDEERYSAHDAFKDARLALAQIPILRELGLWPLFMGSPHYPGPGEMPTIRELMRATEEGLKLDREWTEKWCASLRATSLELHMKWSAMFPTLNPHSTKDLRGLLYREFALPFMKSKEDGLSTDELALMKLKTIVTNEGHADPRCTPDLFDLLLSIRAAAKNLKTYAAPMLAYGDGRVHPSYLPEAKDRDKRGRKGNTATGRLAASYPNIANQPKEARHMYVPDDPSWCFVQADYKSAELYVLAAVSGDQVLMDDLKGDIHSRNAERLRTDRRTAKNVIYADQYFAGAAKISDMILAQQHFFVPPDECARIQAGLRSLYHKATAYRRALGDQCVNELYVRNPFGRIRFFYDRHVPAAVNFIPQSTVADILWCVLRDVARVARRHGGRFTTTVYDSILVQVPTAAVDACIGDMRTTMERQFDCVAPGFYLPVAFEVGAPSASWAEMKEYGLQHAA